MSFMSSILREVVLPISATYAAHEAVLGLKKFNNGIPASAGLSPLQEKPQFANSALKGSMKLPPSPLMTASTNCALVSQLCMNEMALLTMPTLVVSTTKSSSL